MLKINDLIVYIMTIFLCLGAIDKCIGNRFGLGEKFVDGFRAMGPLTLYIVGIASLAPVISTLITPIIIPIASLVGADPATLANMILALDTGGHALAVEMSQSKDAELFAWVFLGTMMGPTIVFTIPLAIEIINKEDQKYFAKGILLGVVTIPLGCFVGGIVAGFDLSMIIVNLIIPILFSFIISLCLWKLPELTIKGFQVFAKIVEIIAIFGLTSIIIETTTGLTIIHNMTPLDEGIKIVGMIAVMLAGAFPMVAFMKTYLSKYFIKIGKLLGISQAATVGLITALAHNIPALAMLKDMEPRGKIINAAFFVSGSFVLGGHLGFVAGMNKEMVFAMIVGKLFGGITAILLASFTNLKLS